MSFTSKAEKDPHIKAFKKSLLKGKYHIDVDTVRNQIDILHLNRKIRNLKTQKLLQSFQKNFIDCALQNQSFRSDLVAIKVKCFDISSELEDRLIDTRGYLSAKYPNSLRVYKTKGERNAAIDSVLTEIIAYLKKLQRIDAVLVEIIKDLDQAGWTMKNLIKAMEYNREGGPSI